MPRKNPIPDRIRVGFWRPGIHGGPFFHRGWYSLGLPEDTIVGTKFRQELDEGVVFFRLNVLYRPDRENLRNRLEYVICLVDGDQEALDALWDYEGWDENFA